MVVRRYYCIIFHFEVWTEQSHRLDREIFNEQPVFSFLTINFDKEEI